MPQRSEDNFQDSALPFPRWDPGTALRSIPCYISSPDECLWMDWVTEKSINGHQAKFFACIKRSDGSCAWYRGAAPPKQEFLDIEDP